MAGKLRESMSEVLRVLESDAELMSQKAEVAYRLNHPTKQIPNHGETFHVSLEPAGFSQIAGAGELKPQYFFWVLIKCKPSMLPEDGEERLSYLAEYIAELLHGKQFGGLWTYHSKTLINYRTAKITMNSREINFDLAADEIGTTLIFWQSATQGGDAPDPE